MKISENQAITIYEWLQEYHPGQVETVNFENLIVIGSALILLLGNSKKANRALCAKRAIKKEAVLENQMFQYSTSLLPYLEQDVKMRLLAHLPRTKQSSSLGTEEEIEDTTR
ncbi:Oidioi.mRNA.OKI2018_I69.XSR.g14630.t1.cds [Oikopleura dioica]|uniref:Oidioi.mRNA.OKI2018_I69.XSR.g14630.t1.cds n=1 Tax=Oikopleura dioica TaxID=34765 RepID=A0ABN7SEB9_OIKDI|nr:Oidioi.mRNA.OKI2018_I69.XSR.g14630.t1.cds [Oikopleura dioica]